MILYHGTHIKNTEKIIAEGLKITSRQANGGLSYVYATDSFDFARLFGNEYRPDGGDEGIVVTIEVPDTWTLAPDPELDAHRERWGSIDKIHADDEPRVQMYYTKFFQKGMSSDAAKLKAQEEVIKERSLLRKALANGAEAYLIARPITPKQILLIEGFGGIAFYVRALPKKLGCDYMEFKRLKPYTNRPVIDIDLDLKNNVLQNGFLEPIVIVEQNGKKQLVDGYKRLAIARSLGIEVPVIFKKN